MLPKFPVGSKVFVKKEYKDETKQYFKSQTAVDEVLVVTNTSPCVFEKFNYYFKGCYSYLFEDELEFAKGQIGLPFKWGGGR